MSVTNKIESGSSHPESAIPVEVAVNHGCTVSIDGGMILNSVSEIKVVDMTDVEFKQLQNMIYSQMEAQSEQEGPGDASLNSGCPVNSPPPIHTADPSPDPETDVEYTSKSPSPAVGQSYSQSSDSQYPSTSSDQQDDFHEIKIILMDDPIHSPEQTPALCEEVPEAVLAQVRIAMENSEHRMGSNYGRHAALEMSHRPAARVRLEERFTCSPRQQESGNDPSTARNSGLWKLDHPTEMFGYAVQLEESKCQKLDQDTSTVAWPVELTYPALYGRDMYNSMVGLSQSQGIGSISHMLEAAAHQDLIIPRNFSFSYQQDAGPEKSALLNENKQVVWSQVEEEELRKNMPPARPGRGRRRQTCPKRSKRPKLSALNSIQNAVMYNDLETSRKLMELGDNSQRERHNIMERDRRRRIRICCDELNSLVPFCNRATDKATALQWTTAFLKYIKEIYGDSLKLEFQNTFCGMTGKRIKPNQVIDRATVNAPCIGPDDQ